MSKASRYIFLILFITISISISSCENVFKPESNNPFTSKNMIPNMIPEDISKIYNSKSEKVLTIPSIGSNLPSVMPKGSDKKNFIEQDVEETKGTISWLKGLGDKVSPVSNPTDIPYISIKSKHPEVTSILPDILPKMKNETEFSTSTFAIQHP
jgi:hypothetical protein